MESEKSTLKHFGWKYGNAMIGKSYTWTLTGLTALSIALHGVVLGLPITQSDQAELPASPMPPSEEGAVMDVAILPSESLSPPAVKEPPADQTPPESPREPVQPSATSVARSQPAVPPNPVTSPSPIADVPNTDPTTEPEVEPNPEPLPRESSEDPVAELPDEPGSSEITEPALPAPPTLAEQLRNPAAYQYDGNKSLGFLEVTQTLQNWVPDGQPLPSKVDPLELPYQLAEACLDNAPTLGLLVVVMAPDDTFLKGPEVISSTGYAILDEQAKAMVEAGEYTFPERDQPKAYSVEVEVIYPDACS